MPAIVAAIRRTFPNGQVFHRAEAWLTVEDLNQVVEPGAEPFVRLQFDFVDLRGTRTGNLRQGSWSGRYFPEVDHFDPPLVWQPEDEQRPIRLLNIRKLKAFLRKSVPALFGA